MRGAAVAAFATLVASLAHTVGGGAPPGPLALALSLAFSVPLAMVVTGERMSLLRASAAALAAQAVLHLLYALGAGGAGAAPSVAPHAAHAASTPIEFAVVTIDHGHAVAMPVAHVAAAALTVAMLGMFERAVAGVALASGALVRAVRLLASVLRGLPVPTAPGLVHPVVSREAPPSLGILLLSSLRHRGPPWAPSAA